MNFGEIAKRAGKFVTDNSPSLLTVVGVTGTITTAILTGQATFKAANYIRDMEEEHGHAVDPVVRLKIRTRMVWKFYIPPATTGLLTVASIIGANRIGSRRSAALAAAYTLSEKAFDEYRDKIIDTLGSKKEQAARDELAQERVSRDPASNKEIIIAGDGSVLCYDAYTGRYFLSSMEELKKAQNDINYRIMQDFAASLSEYYSLIGLPPTSMSEEVGWNTDKLLELRFSTVLSENGKPCISIDFNVLPIRNYFRVGG